MAPSGQHRCTTCNQSFGRRSSLQRHVDTVHSLTPAYACTIVGCHQKFKRKCDRTRHEANQHCFSKEICDHCGKFVRKDGLRKHKEGQKCREEAAILLQAACSGDSPSTDSHWAYSSPFDSFTQTTATGSPSSDHSYNHINHQAIDWDAEAAHSQFNDAGVFPEIAVDTTSPYVNTSFYTTPLVVPNNPVDTFLGTSYAANQFPEFYEELPAMAQMAFNGDPSVQDSTYLDALVDPGLLQPNSEALTLGWEDELIDPTITQATQKEYAYLPHTRDRPEDPGQPWSADAEAPIWTRRRTEDESSPWSRRVVLSLDGGGIRGYSSLLILKELMHRVHVLGNRLEEHNEIPPDPAASTNFAPASPSTMYLEHSDFDFMYGTSTGGQIATILGRLRTTVAEELELQRRIGDDIFKERTNHDRLYARYGLLDDRFGLQRSHHQDPANSHGAHISALAAAVRNGYTEVAQKLLERGAHIDHRAVYALPFANRHNLVQSQLHRFFCGERGCGRIFSTRSDLGKHARAHMRPPTTPFSCPTCTGRFHFSKDLQRHMVPHHTNDSTQSCGELRIRKASRSYHNGRTAVVRAAHITDMAACNSFGTDPRSRDWPITARIGYNPPMTALIGANDTIMSESPTEMVKNEVIQEEVTRIRQAWEKTKRAELGISDHSTSVAALIVHWSSELDEDLQTWKEVRQLRHLFAETYETAHKQDYTDTGDFATKAIALTQPASSSRTSGSAEGSHLYFSTSNELSVEQFSASCLNVALGVLSTVLAIVGTFIGHWGFEYSAIHPLTCQRKRITAEKFVNKTTNQNYKHGNTLTELSWMHRAFMGAWFATFTL